jgi:8-oxo-dGTP pyrophosphatase MutT (NUDIX family)
MSRPVIEASGGIVERRSPEGTRIAVIYRERYGPEWSLPKGKRLPGETWQETALREVREEIGVIATS